MEFEENGSRKDILVIDMLYVLDEAAVEAPDEDDGGVVTRDEGNGGMRLADFQKHPAAAQAGLIFWSLRYSTLRLACGYRICSSCRERHASYMGSTRPYTAAAELYWWSVFATASSSPTLTTTTSDMTTTASAMATGVLLSA
jgi:hypothetical protein